MFINVYIQGQQLTLFKDETVTLNSSVQNVKDISKLFTDYTQSFTVPANPNNNKIFKHWYNADITNGYTTKKRIDASIELNYLPFKVGKMQLEGALLKNGIPYAYRLTFYGNTVKLTDLFGEDELNDLPMTQYNHPFDDNSVFFGVTDGFYGGDVIYPLISPVRNWLWDSNDDLDLEYASSTLPTTSNGILWSELKPALKIARIVDAIEQKYSITFNGFFDSADFNKIFLWTCREKGYMNAFGEPLPLSIGGNTEFEIEVDSDGTTSGTFVDDLEIVVTPEAGFADTEYTVIVDDGSNVAKYDRVGTSYIRYNFFFQTSPATKTIKYWVRSKGNFQFNATLTEYETIVTSPPLSISDTTTVIGSTGVQSTAGTVYMCHTIVDGVKQDGQQPKMLVKDFLQGIIKMFNLVVIPITSSTYNVVTLNEWYSTGTYHDVTKYIDISQVDISRAKLNNKISFKYQESDTILAEKFRDLNNRNYGDLEAEFNYDGSNLSIEVPFENIIFERLASQQDGTLSDVHVGKALDSDLEPVETKPILFYNRGEVAADLSVIDITGSKIPLLKYQNVGQENALETADITNSLNFGSEISTWNLQVQEESLYANYWQDYIVDLYNDGRRIYKFDGIFPINLLISLDLNDKLIIRDRTFIINEMVTDLTTGKVKLELLNAIGSLSVTGETEETDEGYFNYTLNNTI